MSDTSQNRFGTTYLVTFPDFPTFKDQPQFFRIHQKAGHHDVIEMSFPAFNKHYYKIMKTGVPFKVTWKTERAKGEFFGYVHSISMTTQATVTRNVIVTGVGAGFLLKQGGTKVWINQTPSNIVSSIAKSFKLKPVVTPIKVTLNQQSLVGHTYWEKVREISDLVGYVTQIVGTELHFHPIDKMIDKFATSIPVLSYSDGNINAGGVYEAQTLDMFKATHGDSPETMGNKKKDVIVSGIDSATGKSFTHTAAPNKVGKNLRAKTKDALFVQNIPTRVASNKQLAKTMAEGMAQLARFSMEADCAGQGDPRIAPYRTVEINGTGETSDGFWIVKEAIHFITHDGRYTVEFKVMTDGIENNKPSAFRPSKAGVVPARNVQYELTTGTSTKPSSTKLIATKALVNETSGGKTTTPRVWAGA